MIGVDVFVVLLVIGAVVAGITALGNRRTSPVRGLGDVATYRITRRMAHALESLLLQDDNFPILTESQRTTYRALLKEWEKLL